MALGLCRECAKEVSTEAASCPHCGATKPVPPVPLSNSQAFAGVGCAILLLFGMGYCIYSGTSETPGGSRAATDITPASPSVHLCNDEQKNSAQKALSLMRGSTMLQSETTDAGWRVVTFGQDYFSWTDRQTEAMVTTYANGDACLTGSARNLEFRSPSGKLVARADRLRGIQMK